MKWLPDDLLDVHPGKRSSPKYCIAKSMEWFLYDKDLRHERAKVFIVYFRCIQQLKLVLILVTWLNAFSEYDVGNKLLQ